MIYGANQAVVQGSGQYTGYGEVLMNGVSWNDNTVSWYQQSSAFLQQNDGYREYSYIAII